MKPTELFKKITGDELYRQWKKQHPQSYLTHFFCQIDASFQPKTNWEIGFYNHQNSKITVFALLPNETFEIKPEDDVFQKEAGAIEELKIEKVIVSEENAQEACRTGLAQSFPTEQTGDGFLVLQTIEQKNLWNFTFISKTLKFLNVKIDAETGLVQSQQAISLVQK